MKKLLFLTFVLVASFGFAQTDAATGVSSDTILDVDLDEIVVTSGVIDIAEVRKTPIALSTISAQEVALKVGNLEFPEIMAKTPGVYATKQGGDMETVVFHFVDLIKPTLLSLSTGSR